MRNMSFALTKSQILDQTKDVTRRLGWEFLRVGDLLQPVEKCMGLRRERLDLMLTDREYGFDEVRREGFANDKNYSWPSEWVGMFCATHKGCTPDRVITRIEFAYSSEKP